MVPEWLPETTIRRRLWSRAKFNRTDLKLGLSVRALIPNLIAAHVKNWYDGKPPMNSECVPTIEWSELLRFVCASRPDIWPSGGTTKGLSLAIQHCHDNPDGTDARKVGRPSGFPKFRACYLERELPSSREIAKEFNVNIRTVGRWIQKLKGQRRQN